MDIRKIQNLLKQEHLDGWLFTDFHGHDFISKDFLNLTDRSCTRRLFYFIPTDGEPIKLLSAIEPLLLDHLPGCKVLYKGKTEMHAALQSMLNNEASEAKQQSQLEDDIDETRNQRLLENEIGADRERDMLEEMIVDSECSLYRKKRIACQYSPEGNVPVVSSMDAGLAEYLRSFGIELVSSGDLLQYFGAILTPEQIESHRQAGVIIHEILNDTFAWIRSSLDAGKVINEWQMLLKMKELLAQTPLEMSGPPFFGIDEHGCDPGYEPQEEGSAQIKEGSRLIIDIAGRLPAKDSIYYDVSWCMNVGAEVDPEYQKLFDLVKKIRQADFDLIQARLDAGIPVQGCEVDAQTQKLIREAGYGDCIMHRTGHNIGHTCHGIGANLDDYETHDTRTLLPGTMFSIEPGIYTDQYGVRLEYDVHITPERELKIYGPIQEEILII